MRYKIMVVARPTRVPLSKDAFLLDLRIPEDVPLTGSDTSCDWRASVKKYWLS
jgi:hypothetical protein